MVAIRMDFNFFGSFPYSDILTSAVLLFISFAAAKIIYVVLKKYVGILTAKSKTTLDDKLLSALESPISVAIISVGTYLAVRNILILAPYSAIISRIYSVSLIAIGAYFFIRLGDAVLSWYAEEVAPGKKTMLAEILPTIKRIWEIIVILVGVIMILGSFGVEVSPLIASLGIAGLAVALALQDTLSNFFAGIHITVDRSVKHGDYVKLEAGNEGTVSKVGWRSTKIRTVLGNTIIVPNSKLAQSIVVNYSSPEMNIDIPVLCSVAYGTNLNKAEKIAIEVAKKIQKSTKGAVKDFEPFLRYGTFGDSGINFSITLRVEEYDKRIFVVHEFIKALSQRFEKEGIEIPYPKRSIYLENMPKK